MHEEVVHLQRVEIMLSVDFSTTNVIDFNVNLHEGEDHVENRVDAREDVPRAAANRHLRDLKTVFKRNHLKEVDKFQSGVYQGAKTKSNRPQPGKNSHTSDFHKNEMSSSINLYLMCNLMCTKDLV